VPADGKAGPADGKIRDFLPRRLPGEKASTQATQKELRYHCRDACDPRYFVHWRQGLIPMERTKFEPFGEEVNLAESASVESRASGWLMRLGTGVFWALAGTIVVARAIYFDPGIFDGFARAVAFLHVVPKG